MLQSVVDCLNGNHDNYILPFLWVHGEDETVLREYMGAIDAAGIKAVCLESRPHPDFCGQQWWHDLDIILDEARSREMKVWILDDKHFPTGQANGAMESASIKLQKQYLGCNMVDAAGPRYAVQFPVDKLARTLVNPLAPGNNLYSDDMLYAVIACRLDGDIDSGLDHLVGPTVDLTDLVQGNMFVWNVPAGQWRIFVFYKTHNGGTPHYIDLTSRESVKVLLDSVYEPHYARYSEDFGKTIAGFFSDEPGLGNLPGNSFDSFIGKKRMNIPWSRELEAILGDAFAAKLPALWCEYGSKAETAAIRCDYMDAVTELVRKNFSEQIGVWCRDRGVEYIGHIIEDNNASEGLGCSTGHYFRSLWGQDMAGIDVIGGQITLDGANTEHLSFAGSWDGEFFHHVLGKLGSSLAHIDPKKQNRCVCECFGAYGWQEGTQLMKYIADHLLADGVNHFVPHAFSARPFPDMDCPPHFYAGGEDLLFPAFKKLMAYMNRTSHILSSFTHEASVAVLYQAEAVWSGGKYMKMQKVARTLREHQIDFDILPADVLKQENEKLTVNGRSYDVLVIPGCEVLPDKVTTFARNAKFPVYFVGTAPDGFETVPLNTLPILLADHRSVRLSAPHGGIRVYHGRSKGENVYFLFNASAGDTFTGTVGVAADYRYDAMENELYRFDGNVRLGPCESILLLQANTEVPALDAPKDATCSFCLDSGEFNLIQQGDLLRYEIQVNEGIGGDRIILELTQVRETAKVWCNGAFCGECIASPFAFDMSAHWKHGKNDILIEVTPTMEQKVLRVSGGRDLFTNLQKVWQPYGLTGPVNIRY